jgi:DNA-binding LacI/PurR family transcriptional regulator
MKRAGGSDAAPGSRCRIAGHDDHPFARFTSPSLTTTSQNYSEIAKRAVETLLALLESERRASERETTLFHGRLVMRQSA